MKTNEISQSSSAREAALRQRLEEAERRLEVEAVLERIRSRALAMHHSDELQEVVGSLYTGLGSLGFDPEICTIALFDAESGAIMIWSARHMESGLASFNHVIPRFDHPFISRLMEAFERGKPYMVYELAGEEKKTFDRHMFEYVNESMNAEIERSLVAIESTVASTTYMSRGAVTLWRPTPLDEEEWGVVQRFAGVVDLAYTRFDDLQKAEARAREAIRHASLDRVRAEIASMRAAEDLQRITPLIWGELRALGVPFFRCGVFIMDEATSTIKSFLTTPEGEYTATLTIPYDVAQTTLSLVEYWRCCELYADHWDRQRFIDWSRSMIEQGRVDSPGQIPDYDDPPESLSLLFVPFAQGMLYIGSTHALSEEQIGEVQSLADVFCSAYTRYEDFQKLESKNEELATALNHLETTQAQLIHAEKMASLGHLTAGIAHEIKNPLNFVNNFSKLSMELIEEATAWIEKMGGRRDGEISEIMETLKLNESKINEHGQRADRIVRSMMDHARSGSGGRQPAVVNELVEEYVNLALHSRQPARGPDTTGGVPTEPRRDAIHRVPLNVHRDYDEAAGEVELVPREIGQVVVNLLSNAFDAVLEKSGVEREGRGGPVLSEVEGKGEREEYAPEIVVGTKRKDGMVEIRISDNGTGIPERVRDRIFEPFFTTKPTGSGTGLGLSLSYDIVTQGHGGSLDVESEEGKGATFIVKLPAG